MAKGTIGPKHTRTIPQMELNRANIGNRIKSFILSKTNIRFSRTYQLVDSSTVLGYIQKECGLFKPYEGVRVAEILSTNQFVDGTLVGWAWVAGTENPADWCTKPRTVKELLRNKIFINGPEFFEPHENTWPLMFTYKKDFEYLNL